MTSPVAQVAADSAVQVTGDCPRCGYDQSGVTSTWTSQCQLRGTCSECGLEFEWADVLNPFRGRLPGLVEHARGAGQLLRWAIVTFWWMLLPHRFWSRVQMHHTIRLWPIAAAALLVGLLAHCCAGVVGAVVHCALSPFSWNVETFEQWWPSAVSPFTEPHVMISTWGRGGRYTLWFDFPIVRAAVQLAALATCMLSWPALFLVLPTTRRHGKLRWAHVWRAGLYPFLWLIALLVFDRVDGIGNFILELMFRYLPADFMSKFVAVANPVVTFIAYGMWMIAPVWVAAWWYFAINRGWKLERGRILWVLLCVAGFAASSLIATGVWYLREIGKLSF